eukprot:121536-Karenia_brevis.AAC.1
MMRKGQASHMSPGMPQDSASRLHQQPGLVPANPQGSSVARHGGRWSSAHSTQRNGSSEGAMAGAYWKLWLSCSLPC